MEERHGLDQAIRRVEAAYDAALRNGVRLMRIVFAGRLGPHAPLGRLLQARRGDDVHVVTRGDRAEVNGAAYAVHDLGPPRPGKPGYLAKIPPARRLIACALDVVHAHYATSYGLLGLASGVHPLVVSAHGDDVLISPGNPAMRPSSGACCARPTRSRCPASVRVAVEVCSTGRPARSTASSTESRPPGWPRWAASSVTWRKRPRSGSRASAPCPSLPPDLLLRALDRLGRDFECDVVGEGPSGRGSNGCGTSWD